MKKWSERLLKVVVLLLLSFYLLKVADIGHYDKVYAIYLPPSPFSASQAFIRRVAKNKKLNSVIIDYDDKNRHALCVFAKAQGLYTIIRLKVFPSGVTWRQLGKIEIMNMVYQKVHDLSADVGVDEIQLDYIRFKDDQVASETKLHIITSIVKQLAEVNLWKKLSIDIFGRVAEGDDFVVGQSVTALEKYVDVICPMLYPSHYELHPEKMRNPYQTIFDGVVKVKQQLVSDRVKVRPYLQAFILNMEDIPYDVYVRQQVLAAERVGYGYSFWGALETYDTVFEVLDEF